MSVRMALARGRAALPGSAAARDARLLLAHAAGLPGDGLHRLADADVSPALLARYDALLARRRGGEPVARILGRRAFWTHVFRITPEVLDPRPETETLVALALEDPFERVLDLGTGSGCILVSLLSERRAATGLGTDLSDGALAVARDNARRAGVGDRAAFQRADWTAGLAGPFDLVVSNPPYIAGDEMADLSPEVRDHDPAMALTPGDDGLLAYRAIAAGVPGLLSPGGRCLVEIGWTQGRAVAEILARAGFAEVAVHPDLDGRDRVVAGLWPGPPAA